mmetsp:Transcript_32969/g.70151  ORF Transcript_32969/g.70151 Transcript_32969/m.70151 type:complete len:235 (+) Transcript_32969:213-917(+)
MASPQVSPKKVSCSRTSLVSRPRKKQLPSSAMALAVASNCASTSSAFWRVVSSSLPLKQRSRRREKSASRWKASATSLRRTSISCDASVKAACSDGEGKAPACSAMASLKRPQRLPICSSSKASLARVPLKRSVRTSSAYILNCFVTLSACTGRAARRLENSAARSSSVDATYSGSSSSSTRVSRRPHNRTSCTAVGTSYKTWLKSRCTRARDSSPGRLKKVLSWARLAWCVSS